MRQTAFQHERRRFERGFTLIELIIAIGVLSLMMGLGLDLLIRAGDKTNFRVTVERMDAVHAALLDYAKRTVVNRDGSDTGSSEGIVRGDMDLKDLVVQYGVNISTECYADGWGMEMHYFGPDGGGPTAADQAIGYIVSYGPDRERQFSPADPGTYGDDYVRVLNCIPTFADEARARAAVVNLALAKRRKDTGAILGTSGDLLSAYGANSYASILAALRETNIVKYPSAPYLPGPTGYDRYAISPWYTKDPYLPLGNVYPVAQVEAIQP